MCARVCSALQGEISARSKVGGTSPRNPSPRFLRCEGRDKEREEGGGGHTPAAFAESDQVDGAASVRTEMRLQRVGTRFNGVNANVDVGLYALTCRAPGGIATETETPQSTHCRHHAVWQQRPGSPPHAYLVPCMLGTPHIASTGIKGALGATGKYTCTRWSGAVPQCTRVVLVVCTWSSGTTTVPR